VDSSTRIDWLNCTREFTRLDPSLQTVSLFYKEVLLKLPPSALATSTSANRSDSDLEKECRNVLIAWTHEIGPQFYGRTTSTTPWRGPKHMHAYVQEHFGLHWRQVINVRNTTVIARSG
jgi:hypothetical protein